MPRQVKPARLWLRPASGDRECIWIVLHNGKQISTGCGKNDDSGAQKFLQDYLAKKFIAEPKSKQRPAEEITVAEVVTTYLRVKGETVARPKALAQRIDAILDFWGEKTLSDISRTTCKEYENQRGSSSAARRELEDLRSAVNMAIADGVCRHKIVVTVPDAPPKRTTFLSESEVAEILWRAYKTRQTFKGEPTKHFPTRHVARFIICAVYTGSRSARIWRASFEKEEGRPYVDVERGLFHRTWQGENVPVNKRAPVQRIPNRLLAHLRRWRRMGAKYVCEYQGRPADPKKAFARLVRAVFPGTDMQVVRHTFRHTAATWLMQRQADKFEAAGYLGMTIKTLESTYGHHHPDHQSSVGAAFSKKRVKAA
jgi:integrase